MKQGELIKREGEGEEGRLNGVTTAAERRKETDKAAREREGGDKTKDGHAHLTWIARIALRQSVSQIDDLAAMVTVLQGTHVHTVPPAELPEPRGRLFGFAMRVQDDAHPQGACTDTTRD